MSEQRLGRGLKFLLSGNAEGAEVSHQEVETESIIPNRLQPRKAFDPKALAELTASVRAHGILQPLVVRRLGERRYELIAGERRYRAAKELGLAKVPVVFRDVVSDRESLELALVENLQRSDLDPIEKARSYKQLAETFGLTHEKVAERMGQDRSTIANIIRLLELPLEIQEAVSRGTLTSGHARALLGLSSAEQIQIAHRIEREQLSVRETEALVGEQKNLLTGDKPKKAHRSSKPAWLVDLEMGIQRQLSAKIKIQRQPSGRGKIEIDFASDAELERIQKQLLRGS